MKKVLFAIAVIIATIAISWPYLKRSSETLEKLLDPQTYYQRRGLQAYRQKQFSEAIRHYRRALESKNLFLFSMDALSRAAVKLQIARAYLELKEYKKAQQFAVSAVSDAPDWFPPYVLSLQVMALTKETSLLEKIQGKLLKKFPHRWQTYIALGNLYRSLKKNQRAAKFYKKALHLLNISGGLSPLTPEQKKLLASLREVIESLSSDKTPKQRGIKSASTADSSAPPTEAPQLSEKSPPPPTPTSLPTPTIASKNTKAPDLLTPSERHLAISRPQKSKKGETYPPFLSSLKEKNSPAPLRREATTQTQRPSTRPTTTPIAPPPLRQKRLSPREILFRSGRRKTFKMFRIPLPRRTDGRSAPHK